MIEILITVYAFVIYVVDVNIETVILHFNTDEHDFIIAEVMLDNNE